MGWPRWREGVLALVALAVGFLAGLGVGGSGHGGAAHPGWLRVTATGSATLVPDEAVVTLGGSVEAPTAAGALRELADVATRLTARVAREGVAQADVGTSGLALNPSYGPNGVRNGYSASETFTLTVRALRRLGAIVASAVASGANEVEGVSFQMQDQNRGVTEAAANAIAAARRQAEREARLLGVRLGPVESLSVAEPAGGGGPVSGGWFQAAAVRGPVLPLPAGSTTVSVSVTVTYGLR
jgi:uncharacterized protein YggE